MLFSMIGSLNISCILPTNHQYIVNPTDTDDIVNITNEVKHLSLFTYHLM
jgi:hypothetical protein